MMHRGPTAGFTLLEVMIALAILLGGLVMVIGATADNIRDSERAHYMGVATDLARGKMYELEAVLLDEGFQEMNQELEGTFEEQGWERIRWKAEIIKIELPELSQIQAMQEQGAQAIAETGEEMGGGLLGTEGASAAEETMQGGGMAGGLVSLLYGQVKGILEQGIRKVILTVEWEVMGNEEDMVVVCYFTNPAVVQSVVGGAPVPGAGGAPGEGGEEPGGGATPGGDEPGRGRGGGRGGNNGPGLLRGR